MALSKEKAIATVREIMAGPRAAEGPRLSLIADSLRPVKEGYAPPGVWVPTDATAVMKWLAALAETNYLPLVLDTFSQIMKVDGYFSSADLTNRASDISTVANASPWSHWQRNGMDARQTGIQRSTLAYGAAYATILTGTTGPVIRGVSPRAMTALYQNAADDDWPMLALHVEGNLYKLYDEIGIYLIGRENGPRSGASNEFLVPGTEDFRWIDFKLHGSEFVPIVRFRDRMLLDGEEQYGIIEPLLTLQSGINETEYERRIAQYFQAFKQRYVIGWVPKSEQEMLKASAATVWSFEDAPDDVKVGQFDSTSPADLISSKSAAVRELSAIGQVAPTALGVEALSNVSEEVVAGLEAGQDRKGSEIKTSLGESYEQMLRHVAWLDGDTEAAQDYGSEARWRDFSPRSLGVVADAATKLVTSVGLPKEMGLEMIPGITQGMVDRARRLNQRAEAANRLSGLAAAAAAARQDPTVADLAAQRAQ
jgi:hypothetical protein